MGQSSEQLRAWLASRGLPRYRAGQVIRWVYERRAGSLDEMTDLPKSLRQELAGQFRLMTARVVARHTAEDGSEKLLLELDDSQQIECVLLRDDRGHATACVSTQVGCAMRCAFCASGLDGAVRNLRRDEIIEQFLHLQRTLTAKGDSPRPTGHADQRRPSLRDGARSVPDVAGRCPANAKIGTVPERLSHIVVMGMGEPLLNLDHLLPAIETVASKLGISARRITISTVGLPKGIRRLAELRCQYHLAVSLHAPNDALRNQIVPANRGVGVQSLLEAADEYFRQTGRRVTYEYVLLAGVNDQTQHARELVALLRGRPSLVNLIPYNPVCDLPYQTPCPAAVAQFAEQLTHGGLNVEVRRRKGDRIEAACGQLRRGRASDNLRCQ